MMFFYIFAVHKIFKFHDLSYWNILIENVYFSQTTHEILVFQTFERPSRGNSEKHGVQFY